MFVVVLSGNSGVFSTHCFVSLAAFQYWQTEKVANHPLVTSTTKTHRPSVSFNPNTVIQVSGNKLPTGTRAVQITPWEMDGYFSRLLLSSRILHFPSTLRNTKHKL